MPHFLISPVLPHFILTINMQSDKTLTRILKKNINAHFTSNSEIKPTTLLPVIVYGFETWSLTIKSYAEGVRE
jgi:hypothetical protein